MVAENAAATAAAVAATATTAAAAAVDSNESDRKSWDSGSANPNGISSANRYFTKGFSKFERSGQDVMARASQIVQ